MSLVLRQWGLGKTVSISIVIFLQSCFIFVAIKYSPLALNQVGAGNYNDAEYEVEESDGEE